MPETAIVKIRDSARVLSDASLRKGQLSSRDTVRKLRARLKG
jgi:hypothetical protein